MHHLPPGGPSIKGTLESTLFLHQPTSNNLLLTMFSLTFVAASLVLAHLSAASAVPSLAKRAPGLSIVLSGPAGVQTSPSTVIVGAVVTNTGTVPLRVLKMNTVLSTDKTSPFIVTRTGAVPVAFTGTRVSLPPFPDALQ